MKTDLASVQEFVQQVAEAIATSLGVEVMVLDTDANIVAGTGITNKEVGNRYHGSLTRSMMVRGDPLISISPGRSMECEQCTKYGSCPYYSVMAYPIKMRGAILGSFCLVATDGQQRQRVLLNEQSMLKFLDKMCQLVASNINEREIQDELSVLFRRYDNVVNSLAEGIIVIDEAGGIIHLNRSAISSLDIETKEVIGQHITSLFPQLQLSDEVMINRKKVEIEIKSQQNKKHKKESFLATFMPIINEDGVSVRGATISIRNLRDVQSYATKLVGGESKYTFDDINGESESIVSVKMKLMKAALTDSTILIRGESGTGKELFAHAVHSYSYRRQGPFIAINCSAIPESLIESELFGYEEGAFTGAKRGGKPGKFELAQGGTVFLDELGDMPLHLQSKLLRVFENHCVERVGGVESTPIDVRIIAATNRNLEEMVEKREFRGDLYYRLSVIPVFIPPLRERVQDALVLIDYFLNKYSKIMNRARQEFDEPTLKKLLNYDWPGNVRELQNTIEYSINMSDPDQIIMSEHLPHRFSLIGSNIPKVLYHKGYIEPQLKESQGNKLKTAEFKLIEEALEKFGSTTTGKEKAAEYLGISRATLYRRLKDVGHYTDISNH